MKIKHTIGENIFNVINVCIMILLMFITVYPLVFVVVASLSEPSMLVQHHGVLWFPLGLNFDAYKAVVKYPLILSGYLNTIFIVVTGVTINIVMTSIGAYFLSRKGLYWQNHVMIMVVITMFFNGGLIPSYLNIKNLGMLNTYWVLIIPGAVSAFNLMIMRTAFKQIPPSLIESVEIDGAGHLTILFKMVIPLAMPTIAVMILFYGVGHWNSWFAASIYIDDKKMYPLQLVLRDIIITNQTTDISISGDIDKSSIDETIKYATLIVATVPILLLYPFLQKYFVKGVMIGAIKG